MRFHRSLLVAALAALASFGALPGSASAASSAVAFGQPTTYPVTGATAALAVADVTGDGKADVVVPTGTSVTILPGNGDGTFGPAATDATGLAFSSIALGDLNGDGR